jgi:hypothetical protein
MLLQPLIQYVQNHLSISRGFSDGVIRIRVKFLVIYYFFTHTRLTILLVDTGILYKQTGKKSNPNY